MLLSEAKVYAIQLINEYSVSGTLVSSSDGNYQDLIKRMNPLANTVQMELAKLVKIPGVHSISQNPITNLLGLYAFDEAQHFPGTNLTYQATGAKSFSIEVDGPCALAFDEQVSGTWTPLSGTYSVNGGTPSSFSGSIAVSGITKFTNYRGLLTIASASNAVRITVTATYPIKSRYRALFAYPYATADKVPWYRAYIPYDLPTDYWAFNKMMRSYDQRQFAENKDYILTSDQKMHLSWFLTGQFDIYYWKKPTVITNDTSDSYEFEVDDDAQSLIPWFIGGYAIYPDNQNLGIQLLNQYNLLKAGLTQETPETDESSEDTDGW
jgi:hypothetical protein